MQHAQGFFRLGSAFSCEAKCGRPTPARTASQQYSHSDQSLIMEVGFCDDAHDGFSRSQPADQVERWELPYDNGTHLVVNWTPARWACYRNVTTYFVDVKTSSSSLNRFVDLFGRMPQDVCAADSKARSSVAVDDVQQGGGQLSACTPYRCYRWRQHTNVSSVPIPRALRALAGLDVIISIRATGTVEIRPGVEKKVVFWCHKYRRSRSADSNLSKKTSADLDADGESWWRPWRQAFAGSTHFLPCACTIALAAGVARAMRQPDR